MSSIHQISLSFLFVYLFAVCYLDLLLPDIGEWFSMQRYWCQDRILRLIEFLRVEAASLVNLKIPQAKSFILLCFLFEVWTVFQWLSVACPSMVKYALSFCGQILPLYHTLNHTYKRPAGGGGKLVFLSSLMTYYLTHIVIGY